MRKSFPEAASDSLSLSSPPPDAIRVPSGENATAWTPFRCGSKLRSSAPVATSHNFNELSALPDRMRAPSGEKATELTDLECPLPPTTTSIAGAWGAAWLSASAGAKASESTARNSSDQLIRTAPHCGSSGMGLTCTSIQAGASPFNRMDCRVRLGDFVHRSTQSPFDVSRVIGEVSCHSVTPRCGPTTSVTTGRRRIAVPRLRPGSHQVE